MRCPWGHRTAAAISVVLAGAVLGISPGRNAPAQPASRDSLIARIATAVRNAEWGEGVDLCDALLRDSSGDLEAHYFGAVCRRELGKRTTLFLREFQWEKARAHFAAVFARDSSFRDILYQFAVFREYRDELEEAVETARIQVVRRPEQVESRVGLLRIGLHYVAETDPGDAARWLRSREDMYSQFLLAELFRRHDQLRRAEALLLRIQEMPEFPPQATCLSLARLYACTGKDGEGIAQATYWNGVNNAASPFGDALLLEDLAPVINDEELDRYEGLASDTDRVRFIHTFWEVRDPAPASPVNARLIEHLKRYAQAEREYEYFGVRTLARNPDPTLLGRMPRSFFLNRQFNDMGLIFIRHGAPDGMQRTSSQADDNVSWLYEESAGIPSRIFIFARHMGVANDWRLTTFPTDPQMKSRVALWDIRFGEDPNRWPHVEAELEAEMASSVSLALRTDNYRRLESTKEMVIPHAIDAFRGENGKTLLDISYGIDLGDIARFAEDTARILPLRVAVSFIPVGGGIVSRQSETLRLPVGTGEKGSFISLFRKTLDADSIRVAMEIHAAGERLIGTWSEYLRVPAFPAGSFSLSDLQLLLPSSVPASIEIEGVRIVQSPFRSYSRSAKLYSYLQMCNLVKDAFGKTKYTVLYDLIPADPLRPEESIRLGESTRDLTEETGADFFPVDLSKAHPGSYVLRATVTDRKRVQTLTRDCPLGILP